MRLIVRPAMRGPLLRRIARAIELARCPQETAQWFDLTLSSPPFPFPVALKRGGCVAVGDKAELAAFWQVFVRRVYRVLPSDRIIVDAGANVGIFTLYAALVAPEARVFAVEPFPPTFRRLVECVMSNQLSSRVHTLNCGLDSKPGKGTMDGSMGIASQRRQVLYPWAEAGVPVEVTVTTLDSVLGELGRVDLLKMDIEGKEHEVLMNSSLRLVQRIAVEYHEVHAKLGLTKRTLFSDLAGKGFRLVWDSSPGSSDGVAEFRR